MYVVIEKDLQLSNKASLKPAKDARPRLRDEIVLWQTPIHMKNKSLAEIPMDVLMQRYLASTGALAHLKTESKSGPDNPARRRYQYDVDFQAVDNPWVRDCSVILSSKAQRRMGHKNQVASSPDMPHLRNRATHVGEVVGHSIRVADHLGLNPWLTQAIALGHDLGHVPFGHQGEHWLREKTGTDFTHEVMGVVVSQHVERGGIGTNLTYATLDGMHRHSGKRTSANMTQEAWAVRYNDKVAYLFADYNDFERLGWECSKELRELVSWFGYNQRDRTFRTMMALCEESKAAGKVTFETSEAAVKFDELRTLMYLEYVRVVEQDVGRFLDPIWSFLKKTGVNPALGIALLTDSEVVNLSKQGMLSWVNFRGTGMSEIISRLGPEKFNKIDMLSLDLDW